MRKMFVCKLCDNFKVGLSDIHRIQAHIQSHKIITDSEIDRLSKEQEKANKIIVELNREGDKRN